MRRVEAWRLLRGTRAAPDTDDRSERHAVYSAALEQAEQLFRAAEGLGPTARPIDLFYGLSQAGRAIAAARVPDGSPWRLMGHGITTKDGWDPPLLDITLVNQGGKNPSFATVAAALHSPSLADPVSLGHLLAALPVPPRRAAWSSLPGPLTLEYSPMDGPLLGTHTMTRGWRPGIADGGRSLEESRQIITKAIARHYPKLRGTRPFPNDDWVTWLDTTNHMSLRVELPFDGLHLPPHRQVRRRGTNGTLEVDGSCQVYPAFPGYTTEHHPLVVWWAVLWTLSMLARYEPEKWDQVLDVDRSSEAATLEHILDAALDLVPALIVRVLAPPPMLASME